MAGYIHIRHENKIKTVGIVWSLAVDLEFLGRKKTHVIHEKQEEESDNIMPIINELSSNSYCYTLPIFNSWHWTPDISSHIAMCTAD